MAWILCYLGQSCYNWHGYIVTLDLDLLLNHLTNLRDTRLIYINLTTGMDTRLIYINLTTGMDTGLIYINHLKTVLAVHFRI